MSDVETIPQDQDVAEEVREFENPLQMAMFLHQNGKAAEAEAIYLSILAETPDNADALQYLGILLHHGGRSEDGLKLIRRAASLAPERAGIWNNLANVLAQMDRLEEAAGAYRQAIALSPAVPDLYKNLGICLRGLHRFAEAEAVYRKALEIDPDHVAVLGRLGNLLVGTGRLEEAIPFHLHALELSPRYSKSRSPLAQVYAALGQIDRAKELVRDWREEEPDNPVAIHVAAAISGEAVPDRAADDYVAGVFNGFADSFDRHLAGLQYQAPELVVAAVETALGRPSSSLDILDAGCGTGLCGPKLHPFARKLSGVDLSESMLQKAILRDVYDELREAELTAYLEAHPAAYDLVVSADTLCYFGSLSAFASATVAALRSKGHLVFTVEAMGDQEGTFRLNPNGRYTHSGRYVEACLQEAGFVDILLQPAHLRMERARPVDGLVVTAGRS